MSDNDNMEDAYDEDEPRNDIQIDQDYQPSDQPPDEDYQPSDRPPDEDQQPPDEDQQPPDEDQQPQEQAYEQPPEETNQEEYVQQEKEKEVEVEPIKQSTEKRKVKEEYGANETKESKEPTKPAGNVYQGKASKQANTTISGDVPTNLTPESAWKAISADPPSINWYLFAVDKKIELTFKQAGQGGLKEFVSILKSSPSEVFFGLLRVNSTDRGGSSRRAKFVFIRFVGSKVSVMQKAKLTPKLGKFGDLFPVKHLTYDLTEEVTNFNIDALSKEMVRVGGVHESFDFGPDQIFICK